MAGTNKYIMQGSRLWLPTRPRRLQGMASLWNHSLRLSCVQKLRCSAAGVEYSAVESGLTFIWDGCRSRTGVLFADVGEREIFVVCLFVAGAKEK